MLYIVGFGPGGYETMTVEAIRALKDSDLIVGYTTYVDLIRPWFPEKEFLATAMKQEKERCRIALQKEEDGRRVALVCSGDSGIYGMASLIYELAAGDEALLGRIRVIPGVTAAASGGALLGAPLSHDFLTVSLSDLLTPLEVIKKRIRCAAESDTVICIYNPSSRKRGDYLRMACEIALEYLPADTVCGYVKNIGREGEEAVVTTLEALRETRVDMFTTVFIGNSHTRNIHGKMVTPRGYQLEEEAAAARERT
ncbi:precorrin-3B C(17)-methyltransferase [Eisenbergiella sp.]